MVDHIVPFYWKQRGRKPIFWKITKIDKIANNKNLPPRVFGDSGQETNIFFTWPYIGKTKNLLSAAAYSTNNKYYYFKYSDV